MDGSHSEGKTEQALTRCHPKEPMRTEEQGSKITTNPGQEVTGDSVTKVKLRAVEQE